ncbi:unnamed protein product, partial [Laminaria digitata]
RESASGLHVYGRLLGRLQRPCSAWIPEGREDSRPSDRQGTAGHLCAVPGRHAALCSRTSPSPRLHWSSLPRHTLWSPPSARHTPTLRPVRRSGRTAPTSPGAPPLPLRAVVPPLFAANVPGRDCPSALSVRESASGL